MARTTKDKFTLTRYKVKGAFAFPLDMLRYDRSFPANEMETAKIHDTLAMFGQKPNDNVGEVELVTIGHPSIPRWDSFGWAVVEIDGVRLP